MYTHMKIGITNSDFQFNSKHQKKIKNTFSSAEVKIIENKNDEYLSQADVLIVSKLQNIDLKKTSKLKWIHATAAGVTDIATALKDTPIILTNSSKSMF